MYPPPRRSFGGGSFGLPARATALIPHVTYSDPELAQLGLTEAQARAAHGDSIRVLRSPFSGNDRAVAEGQTEGLVKIVTTRHGRILGAGIAGEAAGDLIQPWVLALERGLKVSAMAGAVLPYPTRGEASRRAAIGYFAGFASKPLVRRVIGLMSRLRP
jgi:pyruvate/2-oxoglutarate dehydrogenase complex dihydrolipoamide dehydrogenase (E3) component